MSIGAGEADPQKLAFFKRVKAGGLHYTPQSKIDNIDPRVCPGCLFPHAMRKHEHVNDHRCREWCAANPDIPKESAACTHCGADCCGCGVCKGAKPDNYHVGAVCFVCAQGAAA